MGCSASCRSLAFISGSRSLQCTSSSAPWSAYRNSIGAKAAVLDRLIDPHRPSVDQLILGVYTYRVQPLHGSFAKVSEL